MSSASDYNELLPQIKAIAPEMSSAPTMPVDVYVQEAENLFHWCTDDQLALLAAGLNSTIINQLPVRAGACREAQSLWIKERNTNRVAEKQWKKQSPTAFALRNLLVHTFRYAFRKEDGLPARIGEIELGDSNSDLVQDLNDLSELGKANVDLLTAIGFDTDLLNTAASLADQMSDLLAATNAERKKNSEFLMIRNQAFAYLKLAVDEICECGKYVFWQNPDRFDGYTSDFWKRKNNLKEKSTPKVETGSI